MLRAHVVPVLALVSFALGLAACQSQDPLAELTDGSDLPLLMPAHAAPVSSVRLLEAGTGDTAPHLLRHEGEMLIEQNRRQYLFAGLAPLSESSFSLRLPSAVYVRTGNGWKPIRFLPPIDFSLSSRPGQYLQLTSQFATQGEEGLELRTIWRPVGGAPWQAEVILRPLAKTTGLMLETKAPPGQKLTWSVRIARGVGEEFPIPLESKLYSGLSLSLLPDIVTLVSPHALRLESQATSSQLVLHEAQEQSGLYLLMGRPAALLQPSLIAHAQSCYRELPQSAMACLVKHEKAPQTFRRLTLEAGVQGRGERRLAQNVYVRTKEGSFRTNFSIFEGETLVLQQEEPLELLTADANGQWIGKALPLEKEGLTLPKLEKGYLKVNREESSPAFLELRDAQHPQGISWQVWADASKTEADWLSPYTALQKRWPLQLSLPSGDYKLRVFTGGEILCQHDLTIRTGKVTPIVCSQQAKSLGLPDRLTFAPLPTSSPTPELFAAADLKTIPALELEAGKSSETLFHQDPSLGIGLRAFPVKAPLREAWLAWKQPQRQVRLKDFAQFLRDRDPNVQVLLECPPQGFSQGDYEWLALQIQPDLLEMFGCPQLPSSLAWLQFAQKLQQQMNHPLKFATTLPQSSWSAWGGLVPAIFLPQGQRGEAALGEILKGQYSLGLRSEIKVVAQTPKDITLRIRSVDTQFAALILQIADQNGALSHHPIAIEPSIDREWTFPLAITPNSRWLRLSLFGVSKIGRTPSDNPQGNTAQDTSIFLLATSNFMDIEGTLAQRN